MTSPALLKQLFAYDVWANREVLAALNVKKPPHDAQMNLL